MSLENLPIIPSHVICWTFEFVQLEYNFTISFT